MTCVGVDDGENRKSEAGELCDGLIKVLFWCC